MISMEIVRLGELSSDEYTGKIKFIAVATECKMDKLGYEA